MKRVLPFALLILAVLSTALAAYAADATFHGITLKREGSLIRAANFDVTLDGRLITADEGIYDPATGIVTLNGNVKLHFGPNAKTFPGEVR